MRNHRSEQLPGGQAEAQRGGAGWGLWAGGGEGPSGGGQAVRWPGLGVAVEIPEQAAPTPFALRVQVRGSSLFGRRRLVCPVAEIAALAACACACTRELRSFDTLINTHTIASTPCSACRSMS